MHAFSLSALLPLPLIPTSFIPACIEIAEEIYGWARTSGREVQDAVASLVMAAASHSLRWLSTPRTKLLDARVHKQQSHLMDGDLVQFAEPRCRRNLFLVKQGQVPCWKQVLRPSPPFNDSRPPGTGHRGG